MKTLTSERTAAKWTTATIPLCQRSSSHPRSLPGSTGSCNQRHSNIQPSGHGYETAKLESQCVSTGIVLCDIRCGTYTTGPLVVDPFAHVTPYHVHGCVDDIQPLLSVQYGPPVDR